MSSLRDRTHARLKTIKYYAKRLTGDKKYFLNDVVVDRKNTNLAVVIHMYYLENLPLFKARLKNLTVAHDTFVTLPLEKLADREQILRYLPDATILIVPNRGRDVLPFIKTADLLVSNGYQSVLKFHSKKSTHRQDGQDWLEDMLECLLPKDPVVLGKIISTLEDNATGIVGPQGVYYPLTVNFPANGAHMTRVITRLYGKSKAHEYLQVERKNYGFFGGTMFWARLDAISALLDTRVYEFEREAGQIDATFAHALERLFCIVPEIENKKMYEVSSTSLEPRNFVSENIPGWSEDHNK